MTAYLNGHTIRRIMVRGDRWYRVDDLDLRFPSSAAAAAWVRSLEA